MNFSEKQSLMSGVKPTSLPSFHARTDYYAKDVGHERPDFQAVFTMILCNLNFVSGEFYEANIHRLAPNGIIKYRSLI